LTAIADMLTAQIVLASNFIPDSDRDQRCNAIAKWPFTPGLKLYSMVWCRRYPVVARKRTVRPKHHVLNNAAEALSNWVKYLD
ncbi:MAG: hypothetical protein AAGK82_06620, partial [Pseudomonadota bacterium]